MLRKAEEISLSARGPSGSLAIASNGKRDLVSGSSARKGVLIAKPARIVERRHMELLLADIPAARQGTRSQVGAGGVTRTHYSHRISDSHTIRKLRTDAMPAQHSRWLNHLLATNFTPLTTGLPACKVS